MAKLMMPVRNGIAMKKIMIVPWVEKSCAKCSGVRNPPPIAPSSPTACWARMTKASATARASITRASTTYMMPIFL